MFVFMERTHTLSETKARSSAILGQVAQGDEVIITRMGRPVARLVAFEARQCGSRLGFGSGQVTVAEDFDAWDDEQASALGLTD